MRAIQVLVVVMGVLIVAGVIALAVTIASRIAKKDEPDRPRSQPAFGEVQLPLPAGGRVVWATVADGRLVVHIQGTSEAARFEVVDLATGNRLGAVRVGGEAVR